MPKPMAKPESLQKSSMNVMDAIYQRRAVRSYAPQPVDKVTIRSLLNAAVQAPTAVHEEPWAFAVIQDKSTLKRLSDSTKKLLASGKDEIHPLRGSHVMGRFTDPNFHVFYDADALIVIYGKPMGPFVVSDCWLAAENLMLAACSMGLGTCVIGLAVAALNTPEWKKEFGIAAEMTAYAPVIVGYPSGETPPVSRKEPEIVSWN
jgi:nitroreductase